MMTYLALKELRLGIVTFSERLRAISWNFDTLLKNLLTSILQENILATEPVTTCSKFKETLEQCVKYIQN